MKGEKYTFGEDPVDRKTGLHTCKSPQYERQKKIITDLLDSGRYDGILSEGDFWIRRKTVTAPDGGSYVEYSGIVATHGAFLKINGSLDEGLRFDQRYAGDPVPFTFPGKDGGPGVHGYYMAYRDERDGMLEVGEIPGENTRGGYPFAVLYKRVLDQAAPGIRVQNRL